MLTVILQSFDRHSSENSRHKFMVQSMFAPDDAPENPEQLVSFITFSIQHRATELLVRCCSLSGALFHFFHLESDSVTDLNL